MQRTNITTDCNWNETEPDFDLWESDCGMAFHMEQGTPSENGMMFCCRCGKPLVEHIWRPDDE